MLEGHGPLIQALLGTLLTWGLTAAGAATVFFMGDLNHGPILSGSLGFAGGVMVAASFWSLLVPALDLLEPTLGAFAWAPVGLGLVLGAAFVAVADTWMAAWPGAAELLDASPTKKGDGEDGDGDGEGTGSGVVGNGVVGGGGGGGGGRKGSASNVRRRRRDSQQRSKDVSAKHGDRCDSHRPRWRRIVLLIVAITVHNAPEGLAVGVGFGAIGSAPSATFASARNLALAIGIQNFPEGMAVSIPLRACGMSTWRAFWWGQLSGMIEPVAGLLGVWAIGLAQPLLPYALAFAAGAMIYVVVDDLIPEAREHRDGPLSSIFFMIGFLTMMALDVGLG